jgi:membrane dipeptidase
MKITDEKRIKVIHEKAIVFDAHAHPVLHNRRSVENLDLGIDNPNSQIDFIKMKKGGVNAVFYPLPILIDVKEKPLKMVINSFKLIKEVVGKYPELAEIAYSVEDLQRLIKQDKRAIFLNIEYPNILDNDIDLLDEYKNLGVSSIIVVDDTITTINDDASLEEAELTNFSKEVVKRMNKLGIIIDITHLPDNLQKKVINQSKHPVVASHSNVRGICNLPENIPDEIIKMIASRGGAIMVNFYPGMINREFHLARMKAIEQYREKEKKLKEKYGENNPEMGKELSELWEKIKPETVKFEELIDHIDYIVKLVGPDHVGIGSDYGGTQQPKGLETAANYQNITAELVKRGYNKEDIIKILGGNLIRIMEQVQSTNAKN